MNQPIYKWNHSKIQMYLNIVKPPRGFIKTFKTIARHNLAPYWSEDGYERVRSNYDRHEKEFLQHWYRATMPMER